MKVPKYIEIKDIKGKRTAFLSPKADDLKDCYIDIRLNGESTLEFSLPATSEKLAELTPECQIWAGGRIYNLLKDDAIDMVRDENNKLWAKVMARECWYELETSYVEPSISNDPTAKPPSDLAVIIVGDGDNLSGGKYAIGTAAHALYAILKDSGWSLGTVDVTGIRDLEAEKVSRLELIKMVQEIWGGYLLFDSINKLVHLRNADKWQPYNGFQIRYKKNLKHITKTQSNKIVTKLYPFGHDDLDIAAVNDDKKYITNFSYTPMEYVGVYRNPDIRYQDELLERAQAELKLICRPRYLYRVKIVDIRLLPEYSHEDFTLGDMVDIIDPDIAPDKPRPRIIRHRYNLFQPWKCELDIGDPEERLIEQLKASFSATGLIDNIFDSIGHMSGKQLVDLSVTYEQLANAAVTTEKLADLAVDVDKLADLAVTASKIADGSITMPKLGDAAVSAEKIAERAIHGTHIDTAAINSAHIHEGAIVNAHIVNGAIDTAKIADAAITSAKIEDAAVGSAAIARAAIGTAHIANGVIQTAHIGDGQIVSAKIGKAAINSAHIQNLAVTTFKIGNTAITEEKLANGAITSRKIRDLAITNAKIANGTITTAKIEKLIVGTNVYMGSNASISWNQVDNKPGDLAYLDDLPVLPGYIKSTYIDSTEIRSPKITGGTITGGLFRTSAYDNQRIEIDDYEFAGYDRRNRRHGLNIEVGTAQTDYYYQGDIVGTIEASTDYFDIHPNRYVDMNLGNGYCTTYTYGDWCFGNYAIGFFGNTPIEQQTAQLLSTNATLFGVIIKINGVLNKLDKYGLFHVYE